jgi:alkanesulfonate monooxygenase SsuD/methylene tetrahydromethanopterin reductase-like flavin-dependent oxidoreductase (luciferase family)
MDVKLGLGVVPDDTDPRSTVERIVAADRAGIDLVGVQDHPYQRRFLDTWTLLSYAAARTERVQLVPDVINLPLRQPAVLAKSAASLDVLSGGRVELGIGAGYFWDAIEAMGGPRREPGESVDALEEAIAILRGFLSGQPSVSFEGRYYRVSGAKPGPAPAHPIGIWVGVRPADAAAHGQARRRVAPEPRTESGQPRGCPAAPGRGRRSGESGGPQPSRSGTRGERRNARRENERLGGSARPDRHRAPLHDAARRGPR